MRYDAAIIGTSFSGSLLGWILAKCGWRVILVDRSSHPRFAIGESATPLADMLIEQIADQFKLDTLRPLARWRSWREKLPHVRGGKKRGFTYFEHHPGEEFHDTERHERSLLVAASASDETSDTHWLRSDVDAWFYTQACQSGCESRLDTELINQRRTDSGWELVLEDAEGIDTVECREVIDATGAGHAVARFLGLNDLSDRLRTRTGALFGHFRHVGSMTGWLQERDLVEAVPIFDPDDSAQHHLLGNAWMWMLRFDDGTTSVGIVQPCSQWEPFGELASPGARSDAWQLIVARYPTIYQLMNDAELVAPTRYGTPILGWIPRISRLWAPAAGNRWCLLPGTVGVVDPLHSTGIAHSLYGVRRVAEFLLSGSLIRRSEYASDVVEEVQWIDSLVQLAYRALPYGLPLFAAASSFYFVAAIGCERRMAEHGNLPQGFLSWRDAELRSTIGWFDQQLNRLPPPSQVTSGEVDRLVELLRQRLEPWNDVGLLDPDLRNRIARSAAPK